MEKYRNGGVFGIEEIKEQHYHPNDEILEINLHAHRKSSTNQINYLKS